MKTRPTSEVALSAIERVCAESQTSDELLAALSSEFHQVVPHDASIWMGVDPATLLGTSPSRVEGLDASLCDTFWHLEFHEYDAGRFVDLARGDDATAMRLQLGDRVGSSPRYRDFMIPQGYGDELRGVFRTGDNTWGAVGLFRDRSRTPFDAEDVKVLKAVSRTVGDALRAHVRLTPTQRSGPAAPGFLVIDARGRLLSANDEAIEWLRRLFPQEIPPAASDVGSLALFGPDVGDPGPLTPLYALVSRARAVANGREAAPAQVRLRDSLGHWVILHASPVIGSETSTVDAVAVIIEAARNVEIAPIIVDAYLLTVREREVLGAVARGSSTGEIAAELKMSPHTVRDHVKAVFEKTGVSSRGELVARLFGEHYVDRLHETMVHVD